MAITIRNKATEELIRQIGRRTGEGPSAIVRRLAQAEIKGEQVVPPDVVQRRIARIRALRAEHKHPDDPKLTWEEAEREMDAIFGDEDDQRRAQHPR